jgi:putative ABC transport system permease protein
MAWEYLRFYRGRTAILITALTLIIALPLISRLMLRRFEQQAHLRAESTPLVIGAKGSRFGLVMHALYFRGESPEVIPVAEQQRVDDLGYAQTIPLHVKFTARGVPVAGTSEDYFAFRKLKLEKGEPLQRLGDCVVGAAAANKLNLRPGDSLVSDPENSFDLSGPSPLKMRVVGLLASNGTADDDVIWCDLKTAWIIEGIGHGHSVAGQQTDQTHLHSASTQNLQVYQEVTDDNLESFHFHGRRSEFPLTAILAIPNSLKSETLLMGEFLGPGERLQIVQPVESIAELMIVVSRVRGLFDVGLGFLILVALLLLILVLLLSLRLRQPEIRTLQLLGCSRGTMLGLIATEWTMLFLASLLLASLLATLTAMISDTFLIRMI